MTVEVTRQPTRRTTQQSSASVTASLVLREVAAAAAADGVGVALDSTRLADRELLDGRLVMPLAGRSRDLSLVGHRLVFPASAGRKPPLARFTAWLLGELQLDPVPEG